MSSSTYYNKCLSDAYEFGRLQYKLDNTSPAIHGWLIKEKIALATNQEIYQDYTDKEIYINGIPYNTYFNIAKHTEDNFNRSISKRRKLIL